MMEMRNTARGSILSNLPMLSHPKHHLNQNPLLIHFAKTNYHPFHLKLKQSISGLRYFANSSLRSTTSEETSKETSPYLKDEPERDIQPDSGIIVEDRLSDERKGDYDNQPNEDAQEGSLVDNPMQLFKFMEDFDIKLDYEETYSLLVFGGGGIVALWLAAAVVGAIDSIPVLPKVLELVGLGYTLWFSSRYLIFKENREELVARIEQIKQEVFGSKDN